MRPGLGLAVSSPMTVSSELSESLLLRLLLLSRFLCFLRGLPCSLGAEKEKKKGKTKENFFASNELLKTF